MVSLSACLIVKNERHVLETCLRSVEGLVDEVVVVDTGSRDGTPALAARLGARVEHFSWIDDFSAARNAAAAHARSDWVLSIDADEALDSAQHDLIRDAVEGAAPDVLAFDLRQLTYTDEDTLLNWQPVTSALGPHARGRRGFITMLMQRLYRRRPGVCFEGRVHELVAPSVARLGGRIAPLVEVPIHHYGRLDPAACRARIAYYVQLGEQKLAADPRSPRAHLELGLQYAELGEFDRARAVLVRGLEHAPEHPGLLLSLATVEINDGDGALAAGLAQRRLRQVPDCAASLAIVGTEALQRGEVLEAALALEAALSRQPSLAVARRTLVTALAQLGRLDEAVDHAGRLIADGPGGDAELWRLQGKLLNVLRRPAEAIVALRRAAGLGLADVELEQQLAVACLGVGDADGAREHLRRARTAA